MYKYLEYHIQYIHIRTAIIDGVANYTLSSIFGVQGWLSGSFSDDAEQELWDVLGSNPALHP